MSEIFQKNLSHLIVDIMKYLGSNEPESIPKWFQSKIHTINDRVDVWVPENSQFWQFLTNVRHIQEPKERRLVTLDKSALKIVLK